MIYTKLKQIEEKNDVFILYACESGSRAWGFPSQHSDYDVRFIYIHRLDWYLSIDEKRDVIEQPINNLLDISGWEIRKALKLLRKSNPSLLEWLTSQIIYLRDEIFFSQIKEMSTQAFSPIAAIHHYLQMAKRNYDHYLQGEKIQIKKYFYVLRPIFACQWIEKYRTFPPLQFQLLLDNLLFDETLKAEITKMIARKIRGEERSFDPKITIVNDFIEAELVRLSEFVKKIKHQSVDLTPNLDQLFRQTLIRVWNESEIKEQPDKWP